MLILQEKALEDLKVAYMQPLTYHHMESEPNSLYASMILAFA